MIEVGIICFTFILILVSLHIFLGRAVIKYANERKEEFKSREAQLKESEELVKGLPNPQKAIEDIEKKVQEFNAMGVTKRQLPRIIQLLGQTSGEHNVNVVSIKPREDIKSDTENLPAGVMRVYIEMVISGSYQQIGNYLKVLTELPVNFSIETVLIERREAVFDSAETKKASQDAAAQELLCTLLLSTYMVWEI